MFNWKLLIENHIDYSLFENLTFSSKIYGTSPTEKFINVEV